MSTPGNSLYPDLLDDFLADVLILTVEEDKMPRTKKEFPKYVEAYNEILQLILDGLYPEGSRLPSEEEMSVQLKISRMTLRQALLLLKEDGVIEAKRGSGNYVKCVMDRSEVGLEKAGETVRKICSSKITGTDMILELKPTREYVTQLFKRKCAVGLNVERRYRSETEVVAYALTIILADVLDEYELDLNQEENIRQFLETDIYKKAYRIRTEMKILPETQTIKLGGVQSQSETYLVIFEEAYDRAGRLLMHTKYYIAAEDSEILINWHNN